MNDLEALCQLTTMPQLGSIKTRLLIQHFGSAQAALSAASHEIAELSGFGPKFAELWKKNRDEPRGKQIIHQSYSLGLEIIPYTSPKYPTRLLEIPDLPLILFVKGNILNEDRRCLAVVGTRNATLYGKEMAKKISYDLADLGYTVVSGLARGIDAAAHEGALARGRTLAVIGSGHANIYPREHINFADSIANKGAVISEFPPSTPPDKQTFPQRNRIVGGMTLGTILIEAPMKSGAMITVEKAINYHKPIFALPGRTDWESFRGNHQLIKNGQAALIENGYDIASYFDTLLPKQTERPKVTISIDPHELSLLSKLPKNEVSIEEIIALSGLPISKLNVLLMSLVLKKVIKEYPGRIFKKLEL